MEKKKIVPVWLSVILLILSIDAARINIIQAINSPSLIARIMFGVIALSNLFAIAYCLGGYKKDAALFFKLVCISFAVSSAIMLIWLIPYFSTQVFIFVIFALLLVDRLILVFVKNLGKKNSFILAFAGLALILISIIYGQINGYSSFDTSISKLTVQIVFIIMVYGKYQDKTARGTK